MCVCVCGPYLLCEPRGQLGGGRLGGGGHVSRARLWAWSLNLGQDGEMRSRETREERGGKQESETCDGDTSVPLFQQKLVFLVCVCVCVCTQEPVSPTCCVVQASLRAHTHTHTHRAQVPGTHVNSSFNSSQCWVSEGGVDMQRIS